MAASPHRVLIVSEIPTPYRLPLYAQLAARPELEVEVAFCSRFEPHRPWQLGEDLLAQVPHRFLRGVAPAVRTRTGTFVYEINPGAIPLLARSNHDAVVVGGYSVFAEQVAIAIARMRRIPYLLHSESTLAAPRPAIVRAAKRALVRPAIAGAGAGLAVGTEAARYLEHYGLPAERIRIVPNTIDVREYGRKADDARRNAAEIRAARGLPDRFVLFAGRLVEDKGILDLVAAWRMLAPSGVSLLVAGEGLLSAELAREPGLVTLGFVQPDDLIELYALAEWTVLPSRREPWGVVVNEALASGCPVIVSDRVGAAADLVENGVNGHIVPARDPGRLASALGGPRPSGDPAKGRIEGWTHEFAVEGFVEGVELAVRR